VSQDDQVLASPLDLQGTYDATSIVERALMGGYGGAEALNQYLLSLPFIKDVEKLRSVIATNMLRYNRALRQTDQKKIEKLTRGIQKREAYSYLGGGSTDAGEDNYYVISDLLTDTMDVESSKVTPAVVVLYYGYDCLKKAYIASYEAMGRCMGYMAQAMGWGRYIIDDPDFAMYLSRLFHGSIKGDTRISTEERGIMQWVVLGNYSQTSLSDAKELIEIGCDVLKWGFICEQYDGYFMPFYERANIRFSQLYRELVEPALPQLQASLWQPPQLLFQIPTPGEPQPYWFPFFLDSEGGWETGKIRGTINLEPMEDFPAFVTANGGSVNAMLGPPGSGKTIVLDALMAHAIFKKKSVVLGPVSDDTNQWDRCVMPLIPVSADQRDPTNRTLNNLKRWGIKPQGVPRLTLNFVTPETRKELQEVPHLTKYDVIVEVADPARYSLTNDQIKVIFDKLQEVAAFPEFEGYFSNKHPVGLVNIRRFDATVFKGRVHNVDVEIGRRFLDIIDRWRTHNLGIPMRIQMDEIADLAPSVIRSSGGQDLLSMGEQIEKLLRRHRRKDIPFDFASQRFVNIITELRDSMTNVFFRDLSQSQKAEQSQMDFLTASLQVERDEVLEAIKSIVKRGFLRGSHLLFWYHRPNRTVNVVQAVHPPFAVEVKGVPTEDHLKLWVKKFNGPQDLFRKPDKLEVLFRADETLPAELEDEGVEEEEGKEWKGV
jgi:hypothetical protein